MHKYFKLSGLLLLFCLLITSTFPAFAQEAEAPAQAQISISSAEDFLVFADHCILDSYSQNMTVYLEKDLDLTDKEFSGIPIFSGIFEGNGHKISGIHINAEGSVQGLFRYLTQSACVKGLNVQGTILPEGSRATIGGIAGMNAGTVKNCSFQGDVSGSDYVGGLIGINQVSGIVEDCSCSGNVHGNHFTGGIAGKNHGLIRSCKNKAGINMTAGENSVNAADISSDTITGTESAATVTDIGGIVGTSTGVVRSCENHGIVGYQHMGYNIGGIAGSQQGFLTECKNYGAVYGRKEIAGIVGQMEPVSKLEYTADTLQILEQQLTSTSALANQVSANIYNQAQDLSNQMASVHTQAEAAMEAVRNLLPSPNHPHFPDADTIHAAKNTLNSSISSIMSSISSMNSTAHNSASAASSDIRAITSQITDMAHTLNQATENLGGTESDVSDQDTPEDLNGKISLCENYGPVSGDLNVGGMVGSVAWENDLDPENDFQVIGDPSLNYKRELRAVIVDCQNAAEISAKKKNVGGIAGNLSMGLVKGCTNVGLINAQNANYVGGIAGSSSGYIRQCSVKNQISGKSYVGGIAGTAPVVTDCRSIVHIVNGTEKIGCVIGICPDTGRQKQISGNYYLNPGKEFGGIDGICYAGVAESVSVEAFSDLEGLPEIFRNSTVIFRKDGKTIYQAQVPLGGAVDSAALPAVPGKTGYLGKWDQMEHIDLNHVYFDVVFEPEYTPCRTVIESDAVRENGRPVLLAEGEFGISEQMELTASEVLPTVSDGKTVLEAWILPDFGTEAPTQLRFAIPDEVPAKEAKVMVKSSDGSWSETESTVDGSYLVFTVLDSDEEICLIQCTPDRGWIWWTVSGVTAAAVLIGIIAIARKHSKKRKKNS